MRSDPSWCRRGRKRNVGGCSPILKRQADVAAALLARAAALDIFEAATAGDAKRVGALVDADRSLTDAVAKDGYTPLGLAAFFKRRDVVKGAARAWRQAERAIP
jgi:ankyrin repeat protein